MVMDKVVNKDVGSEVCSCPNCGSGAMEPFYEVRDVPAHSVLLMPTREKAVNYRRRDLVLGFCDRCGFIGNTMFDSTVHEYSSNCEETQGYSPTFNGFARGLAKDAVQRYGLEGKSALEIGCGKGEFLVMLCEEGMKQGIGIDPAYVPGRLESEVASRIEFIQDLYDERYSHLMADMICCRHTLEHIAPTGDFVRTLRRTIGDRKETVVFFELPDVYRVLREGAFWDIYYEHCSYFTVGSLARLFRRNGFDVCQLEAGFDKQYIILAAKPTSGGTEARLPIENDLEDVRKEVGRFPKRFAQLAKGWMDTIRLAHASGEKVVLWGGGSKAVSFLTTLGLGEEVECVVDINPHKQGKYIPGSGHPVVGPAPLKEVDPGLVVLMNPIYEGEVRKALGDMGVSSTVLAV